MGVVIKNMASQAETVLRIETPEIPYRWVCSSCGSNFCLLTRAKWCIHTKEARYGMAPTKAEPVTATKPAVSIDDGVVGWDGAEVILSEQE